MSNGIGSRIEEFKASFDRLSARERVMVGGLVSVFVVLIILGVGYWIGSGLEEIETRNADTRKALTYLRRHQNTYLQHRRRMAALGVRMGHSPLELNSYVEKAASAVGVTIAESGGISPIPGDRFTRRGVEIKLNRVTIGQLGSLLKTIEDDTAHIVQVTRLAVRTRWNRNQELDVEMVVSTYDRSTKKSKPRRPTKRRRRGRS